MKKKLLSIWTTTILVSLLFASEGSAQSFGAQNYIINGKTFQPQSVHSADIDGDGDADVLVASSGDDNICWYPNDGTGVFGAQREISTFAIGSVPSFLRLHG